MKNASIFWRRLDVTGLETARILWRDPIWHLDGTALFLYEQWPCRLDYTIRCDEYWETVACQVTGRVGDREIETAIAVGEGQSWRLNGQEISVVAGCIDIDLNFSPVTNTLPIRRLNLAIGQSAAVTAAWLRFPSFELEPLRQTYTRLGERAYRYESGGGSFRRDLLINEHGLVVDYPGVWTSAEVG